MPAPCQAMQWELTDDTPFIKQAIARYNFRMPAYTKPVIDFGQLAGSPGLDGHSAMSWVLMESAHIKMEQAG